MFTLEKTIHIVAELVLFIALYYVLSSRTARISQAAEERMRQLEERVAFLESVLLSSQPAPAPMPAPAPTFIVTARSARPEPRTSVPKPTLEEVEPEVEVMDEPELEVEHQTDVVSKPELEADSSLELVESGCLPNPLSSEDRD